MELFRRALEGNESKLANEIDVDHGLWLALKSEKVLTQAHINDCKSQVCRTQILILVMIIAIFQFYIATMALRNKI